MDHVLSLFHLISRDILAHQYSQVSFLLFIGCSQRWAMMCVITFIQRNKGNVSLAKGTDQTICWSMWEEVLELFPGGSGAGWRPASLRTYQINLPETRGSLWLSLLHPQQFYLSQLETGLIPWQVEGQETMQLPHVLGAGRGLEVQVSRVNSGKVAGEKSSPPPSCSGPADLVQKRGVFPARYSARPHVLDGRYAPVST